MASTGQVMPTPAIVDQCREPGITDRTAHFGGGGIDGRLIGDVDQHRRQPGRQLGSGLPDEVLPVLILPDAGENSYPALPT